MEKVVSVKKLIDDLGLTAIDDSLISNGRICLSETHRPGVELTGFLIGNENEIEKRVHIIGKEEIKYLESLPKNIMEYNLTHYLNYNFPCLIVTEDVIISKEIIIIAKIVKKPILLIKEKIEVFAKKIRTYLEKELAPEIVLHNFTMLEVFGVGIMITGDESAKIGTTIELLEKGQRFITDDLLVIKRVAQGLIMAENGYNQKEEDYNYFLHLNENEKLNVVDYFGIGATRKSKEIDLIIKFEKWVEGKFYDRLGIDTDSQYILGVEVPKLVVPVRKGRNLAIILETAAINERLKKSGQNSALFFLEETKRLIKENSQKRSESDMKFIKFLNLEEIRDKFSYNILNGENFIEEKKVYTPEIHRPSLEFTGFYEIMEEGGRRRLQLIGEAELNYIDRMPMEKRAEYLEKYFEYDFPGVILSGVKNAPDYFLERAIEKDVVLLSSEKSIRDVTTELMEYLQTYFAPTITMHGVLVEVFGFGVLLTGRSGIGKSETALELIHRNHRLIADDMVKFTRSTDGRIVGTAEKVPYFMEIRGLGIIDIKTLYGLGSVRKSKQLDVIIELNELKDEEYLTKTDYQEEEIEVMGEKINKIKLLISSGRNAASMVEIATMNLRAKKVGYDSNEIYLKNYENIVKISSKKENIFLNIGNLITGGDEE